MSSKECKFGCHAILTWDNGKRVFLDPDGTQHTKERCESLKAKPQTKPAPTLEDALNEIRQSISHLAKAVEAISARSRA